MPRNSYTLGDAEWSPATRDLDRALSTIMSKSPGLEKQQGQIHIPSVPDTLSHEALRKLGSKSGQDYSLGRLLYPWAKSIETSDLYPFQEEGVDWLCSRKRAILADDMGLGKTVQAIEALRRLVQGQEVIFSLIVAPRSLLYNWISELGKWAPELSVSLVIPNSSSASGTWIRRLGKSHVILTSYEQLRHPENISKFNFDLIIADEAHRLRNRQSDQSAGFRKLNTDRVWLLSGTPIERDLEDLLTLMSILSPGQFSVSDQRLLPALIRQRAKKYVLRRIKTDVLPQLPLNTQKEEILELTEKQREAYDLANKWHRGSNPLTVFSKLREICDFDVQSGESSKLRRALEIVVGILNLGESVVVFSFWSEPQKAFLQLLREVDVTKIHLFTSELSLSQRNEVADKFSNEGGVFLASGHIASEGLTLVRANHVIFLNRWWNPSLNRQAQDRINRIGQNSPTFTYTFTCLNTIEEAIQRVLDKKIDTEKEFIDELVQAVSAESYMAASSSLATAATQRQARMSSKEKISPRP